MAPEHFPLFSPEEPILKQRPLVKGDIVIIRRPPGPHSRGSSELHEGQTGKVECFPNNNKPPNESRIVEIAGKNPKNGSYWSLHIPENELGLIE